jgi:hypothetical protein
MTVPPDPRAERARRLARRLGVEYHPDLVELVPPAAWDEYPTRAELTEAGRVRDAALDRRLHAVRDALGAAQPDEARRLLGRALAVGGGIAAAVALVQVWRRSSSVTGRARDHGGSCAGQRQALHRRRMG